MLRLILNFGCIRTSHPEVFRKKGVLKNFAKFTGKHLCQSPFFNKVAGYKTPPVAASAEWNFISLGYKCLKIFTIKKLV